MIEPRVLFTTRHYNKPDQAPSSERATAQIVNDCIMRAIPHMPNNRVPAIRVTGKQAFSSEEYVKMKEKMASQAFPCPIAVILNGDCILWAEDARALPDTLERATAILRCVNLTREGRLPF